MVKAFAASISLYISILSAKYPPVKHIANEANVPTKLTKPKSACAYFPAATYAYINSAAVAYGGTAPLYTLVM